MTQRFEFEIDTTKAVDFWQKELVEKAAQKAAALETQEA
jgi:hypothetical protein